MKVALSKLRKFLLWIWAIRIFRAKNEYQIPPVLSEKTPLDVERWLRQVDLYTIGFGCNRADALIRLVDEKLRDILRSHELSDNEVEDLKDTSI